MTLAWLSLGSRPDRCIFSEIWQKPDAGVRR